MIWRVWNFEPGGEDCMGPPHIAIFTLT
ncbi:TPA: DUF905 family protein [Klebsiella pneumoniae]